MAIDIVLTGVAMAFVLGATTIASRHQPVSRPLDLPGYLWLAGTALLLLVCRRFPLPAFVATAALAGAYYWSPYPNGPLLVVPTITLFMLTRASGPVRASVAGGGLLLVWLLARPVAGGPLSLDARAGLIVVWLAAVVGIGTAVRNRVSAVRAAKERAAEHDHRLAEQERVRLAREVHDVVAHSLAMINVQAGVAAHVADRRPEQAQQALQHIKEASAFALTDLRATLAVLRTGHDTAPEPSLRQASELFEHARAAGLIVRVHGEPGQLPTPTDSSAYRILQEALTNVVRHAHHPDRVDVHFEHDQHWLRLTIRDDGQAPATPVMGNGLRGMRERAEALGGSVQVGVDEDGFAVRAELPIRGGEA